MSRHVSQGQELPLDPQVIEVDLAHDSTNAIEVLIAGQAPE
jgi:hypothetical protein